MACRVAIVGVGIGVTAADDERCFVSCFFPELFDATKMGGDFELTLRNGFIEVETLKLWQW